MKLLTAVGLSLVLFSSVSSIEANAHISAAKQALDACMKNAQDKYDSCIELATEMEKDGPEHVKNFATAQELLKGGCKKKLDTDLQSCRPKTSSVTSSAHPTASTP
jgi:hypothetical protein